MSDPKRDMKNCEHCGAAYDADWKAGRRYCSRQCYGLTRRGPDHHNYKGGNLFRGYRRVYVDGVLTMEHRHVMEVHIGRKLQPGEVVHHKDGDRLNNAIENLQLFSRNTLHMKEHARLFRDDERKQCSRCGEIKPRPEFPFHAGRRPDVDPYDTVCKSCYNLGRRPKRRKARDGPFPS